MAKHRKSGIAVGWLLAGLVLIEIALVLLLVPSEHVERYNDTERVAVAAELGKQAEQNVLENANSWFHATLIEPGFVEAVHEYLFGASDHGSVRGAGWMSYLEDRVATLWHALYALYYRLALIWLWVPYLLPIALPMFVDAFQERRVRQWRFSFVSPLSRALASRSRLIVVSTLLGAVLIPFHVPVLIYPILFAVLMTANWVWVANLQKRL